MLKKDGIYTTFLFANAKNKTYIYKVKSLIKIKSKIMEGYCVKCKSKKEIKDANEVTMKNGRKALKGSCPTCGTGMFRILGKS